MQEYLCTLFAHEAFQKDFFKNYQAAYQQYTHRKSQPPNSSEIIAVCTALFDKQNISIYNTHFLAFMQKVKKLCTEADALFDDDQQAEGISARPAGQTKKQVSLDPTHKQLSIDLLPVQDYLHIYQDVLNRHHYEIDPQVVMPRAGLVLDKRLHFTNQPSVTYGQDYTVSYSSSPLQFSVTILDYTKFTFPIACTFDLEGETSYDTQQYGKITGKRVYPCFLSIESV